MVDAAFAGKTVAVIGMARTGMAAAEVLADLGARVILYDRKPAHELERELEQAKRLGVEACPGHQTVDLQGIDLLVPSPGVPATAPVFDDARRRGVEVWSEIELAYRVSRAPIIAITGTNGKTTTTILLGHMLESDGRETYVAGNVAADNIKLPLVTAAHRATADGVIVAEVSTFQLEWISSFRPKIAALLNIGADHGDRHTPEEYAGLKERVFEYQTPEDFSIGNLDNPGSLAAASRSRGNQLLFSRRGPVEQGAFIREGRIVVRVAGQEVEACSLEDIRLPGTHNQENVLAACCAAVALGAKPDRIAAAVRGFGGVVHRMEHVATIDGVAYINNSMCTNTDAFVRSLDAIEGPAVVIAGGKHKGGDLGPVAEAVKQHARHLVLIGVSAGEIEAAVRSAGFSDITRADSMEEAVRAASSVASPGDTVILAPACASFDMYTGFEERGQVFKDTVNHLKVSGRGERR